MLETSHNVFLWKGQGLDLAAANECAIIQRESLYDQSSAFDLCLLFLLHAGVFQVISSNSCKACMEFVTQRGKSGSEVAL